MTPTDQAILRARLRYEAWKRIAYPNYRPRFGSRSSAG